MVSRQLAGSTVTRSFYLAGGTGLALHLGHRISVDFDWFSRTNALAVEDRARLIGALRDLDPDLVVLQDEDGTLTAAMQDVAVSFFAYDHDLVEATVVIGDLTVASLADIAAMKLAAIVGRGSKKDFIDLYFLMLRRPLDHWLAAAERKYQGVRDFGALALHALTYFDDADGEPAPRMLSPAPWPDVQTAIRREVRRVGRMRYGLD